MTAKRSDELKSKLSMLLPELNERQRRLLVGAEAIELGYGGITALAEMTGMSRNTVLRGIEDLEIGKRGDKSRENRIRKVGGGRKKLIDNHPEIKEMIESFIEPVERGDPQSPLRWTCKSVRNIADMLRERGIEASHKSVAKILRSLDFSLQGNKKTKEGKKAHPDRDAQFRFINRSVKSFMKSRDPVISVDTKKKELVGNYKNIGKEWQKKGQPIEVNSHDFPDPKVGKAIPYGIYDMAYNDGWISLGITADTAEFAVNAIRKWWYKIGIQRYGNATKILICADCGGSNSNRSKLWKCCLQKLCNEIGLEISVRHFPPGTSKWNKGPSLNKLINF